MLTPATVALTSFLLKKLIGTISSLSLLSDDWHSDESAYICFPISLVLFFKLSPWLCTGQCVVEWLMETMVDEIDGKVSVLSQANPLYDNTMKLYEADRYDFQHSGKTKLHYFYFFIIIII